MTGIPLNGQNAEEFFKKAEVFFNSHVQDGRVAYSAIKEKPETLNELLQLGADLKLGPEQKEIYQAFWINSYNLLVIKSVVDSYPIQSPLEVPGFFDKTKHRIGSMDISLNDIENKLLRANFPEEARFHFVLVCAGLGCPPIINMAYLPTTLNRQLQKQTELSLNDPNFIQLSKKKIKISQIFQWYKEDFTRDNKSLVNFINTYREMKLPEDAKVGYYTYDWTLNDLK